MRREKLIQLIHIASKNAKQCAKCQRMFYGNTCPECESQIYTNFTKDNYKDLLLKVTGKTSCKELQEFELKKVYEVFKKAGFTPASNKSEVVQEVLAGNRGTINTIYSRGKQVLGPAYKKRIYGFVKLKFKGKSLNSLSKNELRAVIGWINRMSKSNTKGEKLNGKTNN
jgi:RNA polymerase subunit RPABC4/transcription elongation factor Spt4